jgi:hypothetical protein
MKKLKHHFIVLCKTIAVFISLAIGAALIAIYPVQSVLAIVFILTYSVIDLQQTYKKLDK